MDSSQMKNRIKGKPEITKLQETADGAVYIKWKLTQGAQKYIVEKFDKETETFKKIAVLTEEVNEYIDTDVSAADVYRYRIAARRRNSKKEVVVKRGVATSVAVSSHETVKLLDVVHTGFGKAVITWEKAENADGYRVNRRPSGTSRTLPLAYIEGQKLSYTDKTEISGQIYFYSVQSYRNCEDDEVIFSKNSEEKMVVNLSEATILSTKKKLGKKVRFHLRVTSGIDSYVLFKADSENGDFKEVARTKSGTDTDLSDKGQKGEKGAYYMIKCAKYFEGNEYMSNGTKPVFVKY